MLSLYHKLSFSKTCNIMQNNEDFYRFLDVDKAASKEFAGQPDSRTAGQPKRHAKSLSK